MPAEPWLRFQAPQVPSIEDVGPHFGVADAIRWYSNRGPCHQQLEARLCERLGGTIEVVPVANATLGLMLAVRATMGRPTPGRDLVAVPSFTFVATAAALDWCGFTPVFVDVDPDTWHLDAAALERTAATLGDRLAGVLAVSSFGAAPPPDQRTRWERVARDLGGALVVDSAAGFGAVADDGTPLGRQGDAEVFSFHATKTFAIGEGGAVITESPDTAERIRRLANFGFDDDRAIPGDLGINAKLSEIQAATALAVLDRYDEILAARRRSAESVVRALTPLGYRVQTGSAGSTHQFLPVAAPTPAVRDRLLALADAHAIEVRVYYSPLLHTLGAFAHHPISEPLPHSTDLIRRIVCLPMANDLTEDETRRIVALATAATRGGHGGAEEGPHP